MVKLSKFQAGLILKLNNTPMPLRNATHLSVQFERHYKYVCEQLRYLTNCGLLTNHKLGRKNKYDPTIEGLTEAKKRLGLPTENLEEEAKKEVDKIMETIV